MILMPEVLKGIMQDIAQSHIPSTHLKNITDRVEAFHWSPSFSPSLSHGENPRAVWHLLCSFHAWDSAALLLSPSAEDLALKSKGCRFAIVLVPNHLPGTQDSPLLSCAFLPQARPFTLPLVPSPAASNTDCPSHSCSTGSFLCFLSFKTKVVL